MKQFLAAAGLALLTACAGPPPASVERNLGVYQEKNEETNLHFANAALRTGEKTICILYLSTVVGLDKHKEPTLENITELASLAVDKYKNTYKDALKSLVKSLDYELESQNNIRELERIRPDACHSLLYMMYLDLAKKNISVLDIHDQMKEFFDKECGEADFGNYHRDCRCAVYVDSVLFHLESSPKSSGLAELLE